MGGLSTGGGSSAVAASAHAGCERFRHTDPLVTGMSRRALAKELKNPDTSAGIPEARWMRAMTFERLVRHELFVSELLTTAVGALHLSRPTAVRRADGKVNVATTASALAAAHLKAVHEATATMVTSMAVPFAGMEGVQGATPVKPDFAIVAPRRAKGPNGTEADGTGQVIGSWLVMGDAKDYERVRSRIDDGRMLKGFLQVALGAESVTQWSTLPRGMEVHTWGALAVPRNAYLQPEAVVECLDDHRDEVMEKVAERQRLLATSGGAKVPLADVEDFVTHLEATFDPSSCASCALFNHCRSEIRASNEPLSRLIELGIRPEQRPGLLPLLEGGEPSDGAPASLVATVRATTRGLPEFTGQKRVDAAGMPGTVNFVIAKSDAAALGVHGIAIQTVGLPGPGAWQREVFEDPQSPLTRLRVMEVVGGALDEALTVAGDAAAHLVLPDAVTGDVLVSIADSLAGVEISRLRWQRDLDMDRPALTFNGDPAKVPEPLTPRQRLAVSFLLEADRSRALVLRSALVDLRSVLAAHVVPGGPRSDAGRLDYLVRWALADSALDHRTVSDEIAAHISTPGARLSNAQSDAVHRASRTASRETAADRAIRRSRGCEHAAYRDLVLEELSYKCEVVDAAIGVLNTLPVSTMREAYLALEAESQRVWRRRERLHASDLVRFGRVSWVWRNDQVDQLDADRRLDSQLRALANPQIAREMASNAGTREVARATVASVSPLRLIVHSRRIGDGSTIHLAHGSSGPSVDLPGTVLKTLMGSFKLSQQPVGVLEADEHTEVDGSLLWHFKVCPELKVGDDLVVLDGEWIGATFKSGHEISIARPSLDQTSAPKATCEDGDFLDDPDGHRWCCRPHEASEADTADWIAERRALGELNPQVWPPVVDEDQFDTVATGTPTEGDENGDEARAPDSLTIDDLD